MALIVPARRDLAIDNLAGVLESQQELRIQREAREHQEGIAREARDKQLTGISIGLVGAAVGAAAAGAGVAGGITAAQGLQITALGAGIGGQIAGGDYGGAITTGLSGAATLLQNEQNRQTSEQQKQLDFIKWGTQQFGGGFSRDFEAIKAENLEAARAAGLPEPSPTQLRTQFLQASGQHLQDRLLEYQGAKERTRRMEAFNVQKIAKFNADQIDSVTPQNPNGTNRPISYDFTGEQAETYDRISATGAALRKQEGSIEPQEFGRLIRANEADMNKLALRVKRKPPTPVSRQAAARAGQALQFGRTYGDEEIPGAYTVISDKGNFNQWTPFTAVFDVGPDTRFRGMGKDASVFHSAKRPDGKFYAVGAPYTRDDGVSVQYNRFGESELSPVEKPVSGRGGRGAGAGLDFEIDIPETTKFVISGLEKGFDSDQATIDKAVRISIQSQANAAGSAAVIKQDLERSLRRRRMVIESESTEELFNQIKKEDPKFGRMLDVVRKYTQSGGADGSLGDVQDAARYISITITQLIEGIPMSISLIEDLAPTMNNLRSLTPPRANSLSVRP